jgi:hypothetical protein
MGSIVSRIVRMMSLRGRELVSNHSLDDEIELRFEPSALVVVVFRSVTAPSEMRRLTERDDAGSPRIIVCAAGPRTPPLIKGIEMFTLDFFSFDRDTHPQMPSFSVVTACDYDPAKLPRMLWNDPARRYYGWPVGTIVRIKRKDASTTMRLITAAMSDAFPHY